MKHMKKIANQRYGLNKQGKVEDGVVVFNYDPRQGKRTHCFWRSVNNNVSEAKNEETIQGVGCDVQRDSANCIWLCSIFGCR